MSIHGKGWRSKSYGGNPCLTLQGTLDIISEWPSLSRGAGLLNSCHSQASANAAFGKTKHFWSSASVGRVASEGQDAFLKEGHEVRRLEGKHTGQARE